MKIFDRYIARQLLGVTVLGVMSLSALLLLGNLFKELRPLLVESGAPFTIVMEFIFQVIPLLPDVLHSLGLPHCGTSGVRTAGLRQ